MANTAPKLELPAVDQDRLGGLSEARRKQIYANGGYTKHQIALYETMIAASGQRDVGKGALNNLVTRFVSLKNNGAVRVLESHTCERMFAYLCELDPTVEGYYVQVPCRGIVRMLAGDRKHVSHATLDFLVLRTNGVELVECKDESWLREQGDGEWECNAERWTCHPYKQWAEERGLPFRVFALGTPFANHLRILEVVQAQQERAPLRAERDRLEAFELAHVRLATEKDAWQRRLDEASKLIQRFEEDNRGLIAEVEAEATVVAHHQRIKAAYDEFFPQLRNYMTSLPARLLKGLGDQARQFYNGFNREDPPGDLLVALHLPVAENEKLEIEFAGEPGKRYDALMILSEGHIRCLGLAILMAKNAVENCPVVIFDDAVNAIDDDHRAGIWRTLFQDGLVGDKQIVLTSHAEEFLQRIEQGMDAQRVKNDVQRFKFLPHDGEHELRVDTDAPTKNYVLLAQQDLDQDSKRDALRNCRYGLENLTDRLWNWMSRREFGPIELKLGRPRAPYELNDKCSKLRAKLRGRDAPPALKGAFEALDKLLGVNAAAIEWRYLNSGVHDAEISHEFDRSVVRTIVEALTQLDQSLAELQPRRD